MKVHFLIHIWLIYSLISYIAFVFMCKWENENEFNTISEFGLDWKWWEYLLHVPIHYTVIGSLAYWWNRTFVIDFRLKIKKKFKSLKRKKELKNI